MPVVFHNGSNYDFTIKESAKSLTKNLNVLGKIQKSKNFSIPIEKEVIKIDKDGNKSVITISYKKKLLIVQN